MDVLSVSITKLQAIQKALGDVLDMGPKPQLRQLQNFASVDVKRYFVGAHKELDVLRELLPELFGDFEEFSVDGAVDMATAPAGVKSANHYSRSQVARLLREVDCMLHLGVQGVPTAQRALMGTLRTVFISHGRADAWKDVQPYLEKVMQLGTVELAQQASLGRTVMEKLRVEAEKCDSAVIVMTGDDLDAAGQLRVRENVMHEIGYFHGRFGFDRVVLLHEDGVNIPSNIHGVVYIPFPRGMIKASFGGITMEMKAMYPV